MKYLSTIGLEIHVQLKTRSKMFCACSAEYGAAPNTHVCPVCLGYPGALPAMNRDAIRLTVLTGLMIGSEISACSKFDRKSYFYPDMPKNYQISQYDKPLCVGGSVEIGIDGARRAIGITRIHLEEDVGKNVHFAGYSGVDFNRAGVPLMEIVTEPDLQSPEEAFAFLQALKQILLYAGVSDCNLEEGNMRCDVNCSVKPEGEKGLGTKTEIKNLNTFKGVLAALRHEIDRQINVLDCGGIVEQETRRWNVDDGITTVMRSKEDAHDYRYFPEPDLMPVVLPRDQVEKWREQLPELPARRRERFVETYGLPEYDAGVLVADKGIADYFEAVARLSSSPKAASNLIMTDVLRLLSERGQSAAEMKMTPEMLADLIGLVESKAVSSTMAREVLAILFEQGGVPADIVKEKGWAQVSNTDAIEAFIEQAISENSGPVDDYRKGKKAALQFLVGQVMKLSRGKADPQMVSKMMGDRLSGP